MKKQKEARKTRPVRMTESEWQKCKALGGAAFIRAKIKAAKVGYNGQIKAGGTPPDQELKPR